MVLSVRSGNETSKHAMENISITGTKEGIHITSPSEVSAHLGIVEFEFLEQGQTVNHHYYLELLTRLFIMRRPELWPDTWILHHDNASAHDTLAVQEFLAKKSILKLDHPPYSPDLALCNFWLFPKLKTTLKGHRFSDIASFQGHGNDHPEEHSRRGVPEMF
jgi:histone-lysine N-methyltransferase SETMAR